MEQQEPISRSRVVISGVVLLIAFFLAIFFIPSAEPLTTREVLRLAIPSIFAGLFFLFFPIIAKITQELTNLFIQRVALEITSQISDLGSSMTNRSRRKDKRREKYINPMLLDTSAIIDGRIEYLVSTGFVYGTFLVPQFILYELQTVADSASPMKRQRGRRGLEVLESIQRIAKQENTFSVVVVNEDPKRIKEIDEKLLRVAKRYKGAIVTCDYNLNKVAQVSGIRVLNVNDLVNAIKTVTLPGESLSIKVVQRGKEKEQGVGYLEDGTMVVIEDGQVYVGSEVKITVSRVLQTSAGRMIFGVVEQEEIPVPKPLKTSN